ncbi:hypothetical protein TCAL_01526 [Tigriopus californicus]|uniref:C-type lectin domain-containing protein n=1 Tax=Tigriopus californicus TaxID=6832 RepID=A0A553P8B0_TIGCA|nr:E-selectin-like [Tigriopus californicus]XP_059079485.1 E-selectin-like [Tigriopus californicus]XP_059079486.1 E-selectin-like [Tigriopus californicus]TRY73900.1 hypothetical protein TCAL_01526 [Tigriopus californicus]|eukprot:TCALIF_01526-PA protein Name:"Similar to SELL L-selectin (Bos taurus)" AED:0.13 eAED:0.13 QI:139/1/0.75/1/0.66/0.75/4/90/213
MSSILRLLVLFGLLAMAHSQFSLFRNIFRGQGGGRQGPPPQQSFNSGPPQRFNSGPPQSFNQRCPNSGTNYNFGGKSYLLSWSLGCRKFSWQEGDAYCRRNNLKPISFESEQEVAHFTNLVAQHNEDYFWTGGRLVNGHTALSWASGATQSVNSLGSYWGPTGGNKRPQPDNREGDEECLAVLNNFYDFNGRGEGQKFHDVSCHHKKPVICEN